MVHTDDFSEATTRDCFEQMHITGTDNTKSMFNPKVLQGLGNLLAYFDFFFYLHLKTLLR